MPLMCVTLTTALSILTLLLNSKYESGEENENINLNLSRRSSRLHVHQMKELFFACCNAHEDKRDTAPPVAAEEFLHTSIEVCVVVPSALKKEHFFPLQQL